MKHFAKFYVFTNVNQIRWLAMNKDSLMWNVEKMPPIVEDLRSHTPEHLAELKVLLKIGIIGRPDMRRPGFYELDGESNVYYIFRYPSGQKVLLIAVWQKDVDPLVTELIACNCPAA